ncbi:MAG: class I SAM-dependent methyltransferase, partial [Planctomycetota bacterium]
MASDYREIAGFYDHEYPDVDYLGPDVACFLDHVPGERVLELGCGTGRAAVAMAAAGRQVTGLDVDQNVLDIANAKGGDARYVRADFSEPDWQSVVDGPFDAVCCFFNTFLALADAEAQEHCLRGCHELLAPDGLLWLDVFHPNLDLITNAVGGATELEPVLFS